MPLVIFLFFISSLAEERCSFFAKSSSSSFLGQLSMWLIQCSGAMWKTLSLSRSFLGKPNTIMSKGSIIFARKYIWKNPVNLKNFRRGGGTHPHVIQNRKSGKLPFETYHGLHRPHPRLPKYKLPPPHVKIDSL